MGESVYLVVLVKEPKYRKPLNAKQIKLLLCIYKFRFISVPLLAEFLDKDKSTVYENLYVLHKQGYIGKRYDKTYRLQGRPAEYYLVAKGLRYLREHTDVNQATLRNMYKNKNASESIVSHCLLVMTIYLKIEHDYPRIFKIHTRSELGGYDWFIRPLPYLYLKRRRASQNKPNSYVLDIFEPNLPRFVLARRLRTHQEQADTDWDTDEHGDYPFILLLAQNASTELRLLALIEGMIQDFELYTVTQERLLESEAGHEIWRDAFEEELIKL